MKITKLKNPWLSKPRVPEPGMRLAPPDGGWGWILIIANCLNMCCFISIVVIYSVLFKRHVEEMGGSKTTYAIITNLNFSTGSFLALVMGPICEIYGHKKATIVGALLSSITLILCAFAPSVWLFGVSYGLLGGMSTAFSIFPGSFLLPQYFDKRKGFASGIVSCVLSLGKFVMPVLVQFLLDYYGYKSTCLLLSAWCLNTIAVALTQHPAYWHQVQVPIDIKPEEAKNLPLKTEQKGSENADADTKVNLLDPEADHYKDPEDDVICQNSPRSEKTDQIISKRSIKTVVNKVQKEEELRTSSALGSRTVSLAASLNDIVNIPLEAEEKTEKPKTTSIWDKFIVFRVFRMMNYSLLLDPMLYLVSLPGTFNVLVYTNYLYLITDYLEDIDVPPYKRAMVFSINAIAEFINRLLFAWMSDFKWLSKRWLYTVCSFITSIALISTPLYPSYEWAVTFCVMYASARAVLTVIQIHLNLQYMDKSLYAQVVGFNSIMNFFGYIIGGVAIGACRTAIGSSAITLQLTGGIASLSGFLWLMEPLFVKLKRRINSKDVS